MIMTFSNDEGQIAIDLLFGLALFLIALMFTIQFVPTLFTTASHNEAELDIVAYRTASILVENPGWWWNNSTGGTDWESHPDDIQRIGLAMDSNPHSRLTDTPNTLDWEKIIGMLDMDEGKLITMLGLYENINGGMVNYSYNITLENNGQLLTAGAREIALGEKLPDKEDIFRTKRKVIVVTLPAAHFSAADLTSPDAHTAVLNITGSLKENAIIQITDFDNINSIALVSLKINGKTLQNPDDYTVYLKPGGSSEYGLFDVTDDTINTDDTLRLVVEQKIFGSNRPSTLEIKFDNNVTFSTEGPPCAEYTDYSRPGYETADLVVNIWK
jgi:hypothetical protein